MLQLIRPDHPVFDHPDFRKDLLLFNVLDRAIRPDAFLLASDGENYIIARNRADLACWLWTSDTVPKAAVSEALDALQLHFGGRELIVTAKPGMIDAVEERFASRGYLPPKRTGLTAYRLDNLLPPPEAGQLCLAAPGDLDMICEWYRAFFMECFDKPLLDDPRPVQEASIAAGYSHLLMVNNQPVCLVKVAPQPDNPYCLVHTVYTPPQYRGQGYAKQAVADAVTPYLRQGLYALLYADASNPKSNAAYRRIGFKAAGTVVETAMKLAAARG